MFSGMNFFFDFFSGKVSSLLIQNVENSIHPLCHCSWNSCGSIDYGTLWFLARSTSFLFWRTEHLESVSPIYHPSAFIIVPEKEPAVSSSFSLFLLEMDIYISYYWNNFSIIVNICMRTTPIECQLGVKAADDTHWGRRWLMYVNVNLWLLWGMQHYMSLLPSCSTVTLQLINNWMALGNEDRWRLKKCLYFSPTLG